MMLADIATTVMMIQWFDIIKTVYPTRVILPTFIIPGPKHNTQLFAVCHIPFTHAFNVGKFQSEIPQCA